MLLIAILCRLASHVLQQRRAPPWVSIKGERQLQKFEIAMTDFHEVRFPLDLSLGSRGGPQRRTDIVTLASGREHRNVRLTHSRRLYDAGLGVRTLDALHAVLVFFEGRRGRLYGFRFRDRVDWKSCPPSLALPW